MHVCVGKEWYRFPSNFFLPSPSLSHSQQQQQQHHVQLSFVRSAFNGQLPQPYSLAPNATSIIPPHFNDENRDEPSRYVCTNNNNCPVFFFVLFLYCLVFVFIIVSKNNISTSHHTSHDVTNTSQHHTTLHHVILSSSLGMCRLKFRNATTLWTLNIPINLKVKFQLGKITPRFTVNRFWTLLDPLRSFGLSMYHFCRSNEIPL